MPDEDCEFTATVVDSTMRYHEVRVVHATDAQEMRAKIEKLRAALLQIATGGSPAWIKRIAEEALGIAPASDWKQNDLY